MPCTRLACFRQSGQRPGQAVEPPPPPGRRKRRSPAPPAHRARKTTHPQPFCSPRQETPCGNDPPFPSLTRGFTELRTEPDSRSTITPFAPIPSAGPPCPDRGRPVWMKMCREAPVAQSRLARMGWPCAAHRRHGRCRAPRPGPAGRRPSRRALTQPVVNLKAVQDDIEGSGPDAEGPAHSCAGNCPHQEPSSRSPTPGCPHRTAHPTRDFRTPLRDQDPADRPPRRDPGTTPVVVPDGAAPIPHAL